MTAAKDVPDRTKSLADFVAGFNIGYGHGYDIGWRHGVDENDTKWSRVLGVCTKTWTSPLHQELHRRRQVTHDPCRTRCGRCSQCVHAAAWAERGGHPYRGRDAEVAMAKVAA